MPIPRSAGASFLFVLKKIYMHISTKQKKGTVINNISTKKKIEIEIYLSTSMDLLNSSGTGVINRGDLRTGFGEG